MVVECRIARTLALFVLLSGIGAPGHAAAPAKAEMDSLVSVEWLQQHLGEADLVVLDASVEVLFDDNGMRNQSGRASFEAGHIAGAGFADLMEQLRDPASPMDFGLPTPEAFAAAMAALGVGDDTRVVLYDSYNSVWAARVWWMLRWIGFDRAAILDGGLKAWKAAGHELETGPGSSSPRTLTPKPRPGLFVEREEVLAAVGDENVRIIDALSAGHYRGDMAMYARPGHIKSAENRSVMALVDESGRFRAPKELANLFDGDRAARAITYCGGGVAASAVAYTMIRLGFEDIAVYSNSLQEWAANPELPMEVVDEPQWPQE